LRHFQLDRRTMTTRFADGIKIPLRPFLGIMGVLPSPDEAPRSSAIPGNFGGNIDCADLVAGSVLYLPVFVEGAGFYAGDAHAAQGSGEVVQTALETAMTAARLKLSVVKGRSSCGRGPRRANTSSPWGWMRICARRRGRPCST
jgi:Predicted acetamidase/formamidase